MISTHDSLRTTSILNRRAPMPVPSPFRLTPEVFRKALGREGIVPDFFDLWTDDPSRPDRLITACPVFAVAVALGINPEALRNLPLDAVLRTLAAKLGVSEAYLDAVNAGWFGLAPDAVGPEADARLGWSDGAALYRSYQCEEMPS